MVHYICTGGCNGISKVVKNCWAKSCPKYGKPLTACDCKDNKHGTFEE